MADIILELQSVSAGYLDDLALEDVSFRLERGRSLAVLGRNGMGKSTLMLTVMGHTRMRAGRIVSQGREIGGLPAHLRVAAGIGWVPQEREVFRSLTVEENIAVASRKGAWDKAGVFALFPRLAERRGHLGWQLSGGEQQMLSIARALVTNPEVLMLDEPLEGLAPTVVAEVEACIRRIMQESGTSVILAEQHAALALGLTHDALVLERGHVVHAGPSRELAADIGRLERYIGIRRIDHVARA